MLMLNFVLYVVLLEYFAIIHVLRHSNIAHDLLASHCEMSTPTRHAMPNLLTYMHIASRAQVCISKGRQLTSCACSRQIIGALGMELDAAAKFELLCHVCAGIVR